MKYHVGHISQPEQSINHFTSLNTIHGVYVELWERGVHPRECDRVCREVQQGYPMTVYAGKDVVEVQKVPSVNENHGRAFGKIWNVTW